MTLHRLSPFVRAALPALAGVLLAVGPSYAGAGTDQARQYFESGDVKGAVIELKNALQQDPGDVEARLLLGRIYLDMQAGAEAEKELRRAAELGADPTGWRLGLIDALLLQGKFSDALDRLEAVVQTGTDVEKAALLARRGAAQMGLKHLPEARDAYAQALALDPHNEKAALGTLMLDISELRELEAAVPLVDAFRAKFPDNVDALLLRAELYKNQGDLAAALAGFDRALELRPQEMRAVLGHAAVLIAQGETDKAKADLDRADEIQKGVTMTEYLRGVVAFREKDFDGAKQHLERVLAVAPGHVQSQFILGVVSFSRNDLQMAEEYLSRVVSAAPGNAPAAKILAATRIKLRQPEKAIELLEPLVHQSPDAQLMALLGSAYMLQGEAEKGQEWLGRAVALSPDVAALRTQLALTLLAGGETDKAIGELQSAVDLSQDIIQADVLLVLAHIKNKELDQALTAAKAFEARKPEDPIAYNLTGLTYLAQGDLDKAAERFDKALAVDPQFVTAELNLARVDVARDDVDAAKGRYEGILAKQPKHLTAMLGLSALAERGGDTKAMLSWLEKAQDANPSALAPGLALARYYVGKQEGLKALSVATDLSARFPGNTAVLELLARAQVLAGETASSVRTLEQLAEQRPNDAGLTYLIGGAKWKAGDLNGARLAFENAIRLDPKHMNARIAYATVSLEDGRANDALDTAKRLQQDFSADPTGLVLEGDIYLKQKRPDLAVEPLEAAYALKKTAAGVLALARAYSESQQRPKAITVLESWVAEHRDDLQAVGSLALLQQQEGLEQEAIASYEKLIGAGQANYIVLNNLAWLYQQAGDPRALDVAKQAYDLDSNRPEVADTYGWVLLKSGKVDEALSILQQAYVSYPTQTEIGFHVAVALKDAGRGDEAVKVLRRLLRESPTFPQAEEAKALLAELEK